MKITRKKSSSRMDREYEIWGDGAYYLGWTKQTIVDSVKGWVAHYYDDVDESSDPFKRYRDAVKWLEDRFALELARREQIISDCGITPEDFDEFGSVRRCEACDYLVDECDAMRHEMIAYEAAESGDPKPDGITDREWSEARSALASS